MNKIIFYSLVFMGFVSHAQTFECLSGISMMTQPEHFFKMRGNLIENNGVEGVVLSLTHKEDSSDHELIKTEGPHYPDKNFHPRNAKLKNYEKFVLEKNKLDEFLMFLPTDIAGKKQFTSFIKFGFDGTYPELEQLNCIIVEGL